MVYHGVTETMKSEAAGKGGLLHTQLSMLFVFSLEETQSVNIYKHWIITKQVLFVSGLYFFTYV